jgi:mono/diheme cytochrome c family protein
MMASDIDSVNISCDFMLTTPTSTWRGGTMAPLESDEKDPARAAPRKGKRRRARHVALGVLGVLALGLLGGFTYVNLTYRRDFSATPLPDIQASKDPAVIARGAYVANALAHCSACHGNGESTNRGELPADREDLRGGYVIKAGPFGVFYPSNLTSDPETGIARLSDAELARVIRHGVAPDGSYDPLMAFAVGPMSDEDLTAVI